MHDLTSRQREVFDFIQHRRQTGTPPSLREIAAHFGFHSMTAALDHVRALERKGVLQRQPRQARSWRADSTAASHRSRAGLARIPIYGAIPAGSAQDRHQETLGCISVDVQTLGIRPTARTFALRVQGDSMTGKHIVDGDFVILEHGVTPRPGDVVAALIDNESTLKTFLIEKGKPFLKAENPRYQSLIPAQELVIQGVMIALIRQRKH